MAAAATRVKVTYASRYGFDFTITFYVAAGIVDPNNAAIQGILTALNALTRGSPLQIEISAVEPNSTTPVTAAVYVNEDKAEFIFKGQGGIAHTFKVPGLNPSILGSDNESIPISGIANTYAAAVLSHALGPGGESLTEVTLARRRAARKTLKK